MADLLIYIPVLHRGYLDLFKKYQGVCLHIVGQELIGEAPAYARELRSLIPEEVKKLVESLNLFQSIEIRSKKSLALLNGQKLVIAENGLTRLLQKKYLPKAKITWESTFLQWNEQNIGLKRAVEFSDTISLKGFDQKILAKTKKLASQSSDWFLRVGAIIVTVNGQTVEAYNRRVPTPEAPYIEGDPRNFLPLGSDTHLKASLHAEQAAIAQAAKEGIGLEGASIYCSVFPCPDCASVIAACGIQKVYFQTGYHQLYGQEVLKRNGVKLILVEGK